MVNIQDSPNSTMKQRIYQFILEHPRCDSYTMVRHIPFLTFKQCSDLLSQLQDENKVEWRNGWVPT